MAYKRNGEIGSEGGVSRAHRASLSAVQELLGAISTSDTSVKRFFVGEYELFVFGVRRDIARSANSSNQRARRTAAYPYAKGSPGSDNGPATSLDGLIEAVCERLHVTRADVASKARSTALSLARALIGRRASTLRLASIADIASQFNSNPNSLYVTIGRFRRLVPELFTMPLEQFLDASAPPSQKLKVLLGEEWSKATAPRTTPDAEIGERIARALPP